jgi:peptide/nickel transport system permease protein
MIRYLSLRVLWAIPTLLVVTFLVYVALRLGTNPVESYKRTNSRATSKQINEYIRLNGLYGGPGGYVRGYLQWLHGFVTGNWPRSIKGRQAVWPDLKLAMANSLRLGGVATLIGVTFGIGLGTVAALRQGRASDTVINFGALLAFSVPPYVSAILMQLTFSVMWARWFGDPLLPTSGIYPPGHQGFDLWLMTKHLALPSFVVAIQVMAGYSRYMRASLIETMQFDYLRTARAKGITERQVVLRHGMRNSLIPVLTVIAIDIGGILGGLIISEAIFSYPGMGMFFLTAFNNGDFPQLMPFMVVIVVSVIGFNLIADIGYSVLDPRIRL